jgi:hypothetical protein
MMKDDEDSIRLSTTQTTVKPLFFPTGKTRRLQELLFDRCGVEEVTTTSR